MLWWKKPDSSLGDFGEIFFYGEEIVISWDGLNQTSYYDLWLTSWDVEDPVAVHLAGKSLLEENGYVGLTWMLQGWSTSPMKASSAGHLSLMIS